MALYTKGGDDRLLRSRHTPPPRGGTISAKLFSWVEAWRNASRVRISCLTAFVGPLPKDWVENLKQIEKLSKHLRSQIKP